jgi:hypothetical protein
VSEEFSTSIGLDSQLTLPDDPSESEPARPKSGQARSDRPEREAFEAVRALPGLSLAGDLRVMSLADALSWVALRRKTGTLHIHRRSTRKRLVFRDGVLHSTSSNDPRETLGQFLVRDGLISEEQLFKALLRQEEKGALLGILLVSDGLISAEQLKAKLREKAEAIVYDLFLWDEGLFLFSEGQLPRAVPINLEMDPQAVVREGMRRRKRWARIRERFASSDVRFSVLTTAPPPRDPRERRMLELATAGRSLAEIALECRLSPFETAEYLFGLCELRVLDVERGGDEATLADAVGAIRVLLLAAEKATLEHRFTEAFDYYQDALALDHLNQDAKKGLLAVSEARKRQRLTRSLPPTAVPYVTVPALTLAKERFSAEEGFLLSRVNGSWDVQSILKLCPISEEQALAILARLIERKVVALR